jgi:hypothetical protein
MIRGMADLTEAPGTAAADETTAEAPAWGRLLDTAGIIAGLLLIAIVIDIWSDGKLISRRLRGGGEDDIPAD